MTSGVVEREPATQARCIELEKAGLNQASLLKTLERLSGVGVLKTAERVTLPRTVSVACEALGLIVPLAISQPAKV